MEFLSTFDFANRDGNGKIENTVNVGITRETRYWIGAQAGLKNAKLFKEGVKSAWEWAKSSPTIRWFTDGERRYGKA